MTRPAAVVPPPNADAWGFARALSPRPVVRVADVDPVTGRSRNVYSSELPLSGPVPGRPYALYLTDGRGRFRLLGFDLDAAKGPVAADLARLRALLERARLPHLVCASGPTGGRHVWVALSSPAPADLVARLARGLARLLPSLDIAPLANPRTGALRPPGAPHRLTGTSRVLDGSPSALLRPRGTPAQLLTLTGLVEHAAGPSPARAGEAVRAVARDSAGRPHLPGERRPLPPAARTALTTPLAESADASAVLATVLAGAVRARWRFDDVAALLDTAAGLEHARSERTPTGRTRRSPADALRVLLRQWDRACAYLASTASTPQVLDQGEWQPRIRAVVQAVATVQARADASPGRWARPGGPADRRVLDELCLQALAAVRCVVELDIRRLGTRCGLSRETARVALLRLAADGWTAQTSPAAGVHAASWALPEPPAPPSTPSARSGLSQADPRANPTWSTLLAWRSHLTARQTSVAHDTFTPRGLGHSTARAYQLLTDQPTSARDLATALGDSFSHTVRRLDDLASVGLARHDSRGRWRRGAVSLQRVAEQFGVAGTLNERAARYLLEREAWAWWCDELAWRRLPRDAKRRRGDPAPGQTVLDLRDVPGLTVRRRRGAHPCRPDGRADYADALAALRADSTQAVTAAA